jgi:hypothetical protein
MTDTTIVSRMILGAEFDPELVKVLREAHGLDEDVQINMNVFETTVSRGKRTGQVLCCWAGGKIDKDGWQNASDLQLTLAGRAAIDALMKLPACVDPKPGRTGRMVVRELRIGKTPLRDKVIDAVLAAEPGDRIAFVGDLAGELDGKMGVTFNPSAEPIYMNPEDYL